MGTAMHASNVVFGFLEIPFLILCIYFAFRTAIVLRGGIFGRGMALLAWGFFVMAVGHVHMQLEHVLHVNLFESLLGHTAGNAVWIVALILTWALSGIGFYQIYAASRTTVGA